MFRFGDSDCGPVDFDDTNIPEMTTEERKMMMKEPFTQDGITLQDVYCYRDPKCTDSFYIRYLITAKVVDAKDKFKHTIGKYLRYAQTTYRWRGNPIRIYEAVTQFKIENPPGSQ